MITDLTRRKLEELAEYLGRRSSAGRWLVLTHDNPDPDAIAAAAALGKLLRRGFKRRVTTAYGGMIGRAENQEMVKILGIRLSHLRHLNWRNYKHFALVDTQPETGNNQLPPGLVPDLVFDHHPIRRTTYQVAFSDIRTEYGATATILAEYLLGRELEINRQNATALVYAIRAETQDFGREYTTADKAMYNFLHPLADIRALARIQTPQLPLSYFRILHNGLKSLEAVGTLVVSHLGEIEQPDIVPEIADLMIRLQGKTWSLCTGVFEQRLYLSIRTTNPQADAGRLMRRLLGRKGKGGGHGMTAGGWVPLSGKPEETAQSLQQSLAARLAKYLKKNPARLASLIEDRPEMIQSADAGRSARAGGDRL
jgi:nanoRNase/pAp phosphatase (c-di-AMP/oligoRNAs hydrolase)